MFKKCLANRVIRKEKDYKCYLCHDIMKESLSDGIEEHLLSEKHQKRLNQIDQEQREKELEKLLTLRKLECKKIVDNNITLDKTFNFLKCHICNCKICGLSNTLAHIDGFTHKKNLKILAKQSNKTVQQNTKTLSCEKININKTAIDNTINVQASLLQVESDGIINNKQNPKKVSFNKVNTNKTAVEQIVRVKSSIFALQSGSNDITYDEHSNSYYCNICKMRINANPNISQHTQGLLHQALVSKSKALDPNSKSDYIVFDEKSNSYQCSMCNIEIMNTSNVDEHIQGFMHKIMSKAHSVMKTKPDKSASQGFLNPATLKIQKAPHTNKVDDKSQENGLLEQIDCKPHFTEIYFCKACHVFIDTSTSLKCHIVLHLYQEFDSLKNLDIIKFESKSDKKLHLECLLCNSFICESSIKHANQALENHLQTELHHDRLAIFDYDATKSNLHIPTMNSQLNNVNLDKLIYKPNKNISKELLCHFCNVPVFQNNKKMHASSKNHIKKMFENPSSNANTFKKIDLISIKKNSDYYICFMCDESFAECSNLLVHYKTFQHQMKMISLNMINKSPYMKLQKLVAKKKTREVIQCTTCKTTVYNFLAAVEHMIGKKHKEELKLPSSNLKNLNTTLLAKVTSEFQRMSVTPRNAPIKPVNNENTIKNQNLPVIKTKSVKKIETTSKFEASNEELNQLGFSTENIQPLSTLNPDVADKLLGNLISPDFNKSQKRRLPLNANLKSSRTPNVEDQRNSFAMNVLRSGRTYIKFCIDPGQDNIFNFDNEKIDLMKLGVSLTFSFHNFDRVCIVCGEQFTDNIQSLFEHLQKLEHLKNICDMLIDDKEFEKYPEQFSDLRLAKLYMRLSDQSIQCYVCDIEINDDDNVIRQHAKLSSHEEKSKLWKEESEKLFNQYLTIYKDIWYYAEVFFCEICKTRCEFEIDFSMHLIHPEHMKKVYELKHKGTALKFDLCPPCTTYWFGKSDSYKTHCKNDYHKLLVNKKDFVAPNFTMTASQYLDNINTNVDILVNESDQVDLDKDKVTELLEAIVETVKPTYPDAIAYVFGSRLSHLGFTDSDVDVFLDCENVYYRSSTKVQSQQFKESVISFFENDLNAWKMDEDVGGARVPILKMRHLPTNMHCDISFVNGLSVEKSNLIGIYNRAFPVCRKLILFMKKWLSLCRLSGPDNITTFAISWCVIFYLQIHEVLPSVYELIKHKMESKIVDGWECGVNEIITAKISSLSFKEHLKGFFTYFANFDYRKSVMCPHISKTIDKRTFAYTDELPSEMFIYKRRLKDSEVEIFRFDSPMCIQDPIDLSQNMTKALSKKQLRRFRQYCILSAEKC